MKTTELKKGAVYLSARGKKFKFVKILEIITKEGFMIIEYIFKPIDQRKHVVMGKGAQDNLGDPDLIGCCRFSSTENFEPYYKSEFKS